MRLDLREIRSMAGLGQGYYDETGNFIEVPVTEIPTIDPSTVVSYGPTYTPPPVALPPVKAPAPSGQSFGTWLESLISGGAKTAEQVYVGQNIPRGVYTSTDAQGRTTTYVQPQGTAANIFSASQTGVTGTLGGTATGFLNTGAGLAIAGGAVLLLIFMMMRGKKD